MKWRKGLLSNKYSLKQGRKDYPYTIDTKE
jgi:hypothetical protein